ncbi:MAG TPA: hypothetical protein VFZ56_02370 [Gemmatimonadaceae bacterium]
MTFAGLVRPFVAALAVSFTATATLPLSADAQLGRLRGVVAKAAGKVTLDQLVGGDHPITTSLEHARWAVDTLDQFTPAEAARPLISLQRTATGGFVLAPGYYEMHTQSYCLKAGTYGPGGGDGYIFAPPTGPAQDAVVSIVRNSVAQPQIPQHDIQVLLWAIIARAKFEELSPDKKATAAKLLTAQQLAMLNRSALDLLPGDEMDGLLSRAPAALRQVLQAEAQLRQMLTDPASSFAEMERVAVLAGLAELGPGSRAVPSGRWSLHPDGYYVRYIPRGYSHTVTQVWVPEGSPAVGKEYDAAMHIAVPGNTSRQRLIQSGRVREQ